MGQALDNVLQPDGSYKWEMVELTEARTKGEEKKAEKAEPAPKTTKKSKASKVDTPTESASES
jgi:hypothetical protein